MTDTRRARMPNGIPRDHSIPVRVDEGELYDIDFAANQSKLDRSTYVRLAAVEKAQAAASADYFARMVTLAAAIVAGGPVLKVVRQRER